MPSLKDLKNRITIVKSTRKITSAMKMVAPAKCAAHRTTLSQGALCRPHGTHDGITDQKTSPVTESTPRLLGRDRQGHTVLLIVMTSDRVCVAASTGYIVRETASRSANWNSEGKQVKLLLRRP